MLDVQPITLTGHIVRLEPLADTHTSELTSAGADESIWRYMPYGNVDSEVKMRAWVSDLRGRMERGTDLPFAVIELGSGRAIGSTRYMDIQPQNRGLEIGGTWYGALYQRTAVNTECKYLLLSHAFETLGCIRVQLKTDLRNERSQRAIERIGAVREGVLRDHVLMPDGYRRSSVYYSILDSEWPGVKARLEEKLSVNSKP
ncbi:MAG: GNAT family N-acetyltransferase [Anaerolineales bacterium]